jgi:hypothetical protein
MKGLLCVLLLAITVSAKIGLDVSQPTSETAFKCLHKEGAWSPGL